jgi:hypothetical protein
MTDIAIRVDGLGKQHRIGGPVVPQTLRAAADRRPGRAAAGLATTTAQRGRAAVLGEGLRAEGFAMAYTWDDFNRDYAVKHFAMLTPEEQAKALRKLPPERLLAVLTEEQIASSWSTGHAARSRHDLSNGPRNKRANASLEAQ